MGIEARSEKRRSGEAKGREIDPWQGEMGQWMTAQSTEDDQ